MDSRRLATIFGGVVAMVPSFAQAANVALEAPIGAPPRDPGDAYDVIRALLEARGHTVTIVAGDEVDTLDEIQQYEVIVLSGSGYGNGHDVVVFDSVIEDYVDQGGGLVLTGWVYYYHPPATAPGLNAVAPFEQSTNYLQNGVIEIIDGHEITSGLNDWNNPSFDAYSGALKVGATALSSNGGTIDGGAWEVGGGRVASLGPLFTAEYSAYATQALHDGSIPDATEMFLRAIEWASQNAAPEGCHDGILDPGEECDDGNYANNDGCVNPCVFATCGDGYTYLGVELCDDGDLDNTDACLVGCLPATCGDGYVRVGVEQCDAVDGDDTNDCLDNCVAASCGDGHLWAGVETCDDGNLDNSDACPGSCQPAVCGDGYVLAGVEPCDDGNDVNDDDCLVGCVSPSCGDGYLQPGVEACDDANDDDTDACVGALCQLASCGDGFVFAGFEECDDGNAVPGDGCTACQSDSAESSSEGGSAEESSSGGGSSDEGTSTGDGTDTTGDPTDADGSSGPQPGTSDGGSSETGDAGSSETSGASDQGSSGGADGDEVDTPVDGCACATDPRTTSASAWLLLLLGFARRRRLRSATRS